MGRQDPTDRTGSSPKGHRRSLAFILADFPTIRLPSRRSDWSCSRATCSQAGIWPGHLRSSRLSRALEASPLDDLESSVSISLFPILGQLHPSILVPLLQPLRKTRLRAVNPSRPRHPHASIPLRMQGTLVGRGKLNANGAVAIQVAQKGPRTLAHSEKCLESWGSLESLERV